MKYNLKLLAIFAIVAVVITNTFTFSQPTSALSGSDWNAGNILDDAIFTDTNSMSVAQIQTFLDQQINAKGGCDVWGTRPATEVGRGDITHAQYASIKGWAAPPYVCLNLYNEVPKTAPGTAVPDSSFNHYSGQTLVVASSWGGVSAAQQIYDAAQRYNISPKVLLIKIHTESAGPLTQDTWPLLSQYKYAMGANCPDSGPNNSAQCDPNYSGFSIQISQAAKLLRSYLDGMDQSWWGCIEGGVKVQCVNNRANGSNPGGGYKVPSASNFLLYNPSPSCGGDTIYLASKATAALYTYTPYQPNNLSLANVSDSSSGGGPYTCGAYGNRNFWWWFNVWFGSPYAYIYNGVNYSSVFNAEYYALRNPDVKAIVGTNPIALFNHFTTNGMKEGRIAISNFDVIAYRNGNSDLRWTFGTNLPSYYWHYIVIGQKEGRTATGPIALQPVSTYGGVDYSPIYSFDTYLANNGDLRAVYGNDDTGALWHFVTVGMGEGRIASTSFDVGAYKKRYPDLRNAFNNYTRFYYIHYLSTGKSENRTAVGDYFGGTTVLNNIDYSAVYNPDFYQRNNPDIQKAFGLDDKAMLRHFVNYGMAEGRYGIETFKVSVYKANYGDLRAAFGSYLKDYYIHYMTTGKAEGRIAS